MPKHSEYNREFFYINMYEMQTDLVLMGFCETASNTLMVLFSCIYLKLVLRLVTDILIRAQEKVFNNILTYLVVF